MLDDRYCCIAYVPHPIVNSSSSYIVCYVFFFAFLFAFNGHLKKIIIKKQNQNSVYRTQSKRLLFLFSRTRLNHLDALSRLASLSPGAVYLQPFCWRPFSYLFIYLFVIYFFFFLFRFLICLFQSFYG